MKYLRINAQFRLHHLAWGGWGVVLDSPEEAEKDEVYISQTSQLRRRQAESKGKKRAIMHPHNTVSVQSFTK